MLLAQEFVMVLACAYSTAPLPSMAALQVDWYPFSRHHPCAGLFLAAWPCQLSPMIPLNCLEEAQLDPWDVIGVVVLVLQVVEEGLHLRVVCA